MLITFFSVWLKTAWSSLIACIKLYLSILKTYDLCVNCCLSVLLKCPMDASGSLASLAERSLISFWWDSLSTRYKVMIQIWNSLPDLCVRAQCQGMSSYIWGELGSISLTEVWESSLPCLAFFWLPLLAEPCLALSSLFHPFPPFHPLFFVFLH